MTPRARFTPSGSAVLAAIVATVAVVASGTLAEAADPIRVHAIVAPMSNGSDAPTVTVQQIRDAVRKASEVFRPANIEFLFDAQSDIVEIRSDLLSQDCTLASMAELNKPKNMPPACDPAPNDAERNRVAQGYPGKLVVYFAYGRWPKWNDATARWEMVQGGLGWHWSNHVDSFVRMNSGDPGLALSHEIGHYLHLVHTFNGFPEATHDLSHLDDTGGKKGVRTTIRDYVMATGVPRSQGLDVFDADRAICTGHPTILCVGDTPPDTGWGGLFANEGLDPCEPGDALLSFSVTWPDGSLTNYILEPDRENIMNYWDQTCRGRPARITLDQAAGVRDALENQNRAHLLARKVLYTAVWEPGDRGTTRAIGWGFSDIVPRFDAEIASGQHLVHMQAYDLGGGQIRYDGVWEKGDRQTTFVMGWAMSDFASRFNQECAMGRRLVHMQAYDLGGGQIRWDGVWESGPRATTWVIGWGLYDFARHFGDETARGRHLVHMQAYDLGGGQIRYDGVWEEGPRGNSGVMSWAFNDFVAHSEWQAAVGRRLVHQQVYDIGGGVLRFDGVWEDGPAGVPQTRILTESMKPFAARFNQETAALRHVVSMQAVVGR